MNAKEQELLDFFKDGQKTRDEIIREKKDVFFVDALIKYRSNIVSWLPINAEDVVYEIGANYGEISECLAKKAKRVVCYDKDPEKNKINQVRNNDKKNIEYRDGDELEKMFENNDADYIIVHEDFQCDIDVDTFIAFLDMIKKEMKPNAKFVLMMYNKFAMRFWAGKRKQESEDYYYHIESEPKEDNMFTKAQIERELENVGFERVMFYYPYPSCKYAMKIFSDDHLPKKGELNMNRINLCNKEISTFDEMKAYDLVIEEGMFPQYSNSFLIICERD